MGKLAQSKEILPDGSSWLGMSKIEYISPGTGASVRRSAQHSAKQDELDIARRLADNGYDVALRQASNIQGVRTADALVWHNSAWEEWEFKTVGKGTNLQGSVQNNLRDGKKQAGTVVM